MRAIAPRLIPITLAVDVRDLDIRDELHGLSRKTARHAVLVVDPLRDAPVCGTAGILEVVREAALADKNLAEGSIEFVHNHRSVEDDRINEGTA